MVVVVVVNRLVEKEEDEEDVSSEDSTRLAIDARRNIIIVRVCKNVYNFLYKNLIKISQFSLSLKNALSPRRF